MSDSNNKNFDVLIVGSGPAGITASIYALRAGFKVGIIAGNQKGGQITITHELDNYPGFENTITGLELMNDMEKQALRFGAEFISGLAVDVDFSNEDEKKVTLDSGDVLTGKSVILATGANPRKLGINSEEENVGKGVSYCATCDGFFYRGKTVCVVGGGNTAVSEALYLATIAKDVHLIHRRDQFRSEKILLDKLHNTKNIHMHTFAEVNEIKSDAMGVNGIEIKNNKTGLLEKFETDGVFIAVGYIPNTKFLEGKVDLEDNGQIAIKNGYACTSVPGVFTCGDVSNKYKQVVVAAGFGSIAAIDAEHYLRNKE